MGSKYCVLLEVPWATISHGGRATGPGVPRICESMAEQRRLFEGSDWHVPQCFRIGRDGPHGGGRRLFQPAWANLSCCSDTHAANNAAHKAIERITDKTSKDYADLQILLGDLAAARGEKEAAERYYNEAIEVAGILEPERSEIAARAYFQKGKLLRLAVSFRKAADIWAELEENVRSDTARWHSAVLSNELPKGAVDALKDESASVRIEALRLHRERVSVLPPARGRRSEPDKNHWLTLISDAKSNVAVRQIPW